ncbi:YjgB family protein [Clostridium sp. YIM B02551]|uniref:YjgB family protein n=1 Tax=Clostridium sp. YIM B02551 TaxID=2910679 RepID=UPI001EECBBEC|nr:YjgB family protein [Clostridium sp. YIM B02551]
MNRSKRSFIALCISTILTFTLISMFGCSNSNKTANNNQNNNTSQNSTNDEKEDEGNTANNNTNNSEQQGNNTQNSLLESIKNLAKQGKIINSDFKAKTTNLQDVEKAWGKADKSEWVSAAKGMYTTYSKRNVVFGSNKGDQVFEVRSYDKKLNGVTLQMVKKYFGNPAYNVKSNGEEILGYVASTDFKILFVFSGTSGSNDTKLDHYSVLYPKGTVNNMADDPGREW